MTNEVCGDVGLPKAAGTIGGGVQLEQEEAAVRKRAAANGPENSSDLFVRSGDLDTVAVVGAVSVFLVVAAVDEVQRLRNRSAAAKGLELALDPVPDVGGLCDSMPLDPHFGRHVRSRVEQLGLVRLCQLGAHALQRRAQLATAADELDVLGSDVVQAGVVACAEQLGVQVARRGGGERAVGGRVVAGRAVLLGGVLPLCIGRRLQRRVVRTQEDLHHDGVDKVHPVRGSDGAICRALCSLGNGALVPVQVAGKVGDVVGGQAHQHVTDALVVEIARVDLQPLRVRKVSLVLLEHGRPGART